MKNLSKLKKEELIKILTTILKDHPEYHYLVNDVKIIKQDPNKVLKAIEKEIANHTGSVLKAYQVYENYKLNDRASKSLLHIAFEFAGYLFEEIDAYGGEIPDDILDITLEVFEDACRLGVKYHQTSSINQLYDSLNSSIYNFDVIEEFQDVMSYCGAYDLLDD
jgi:hypothetical protein